MKLFQFIAKWQKRHRETLEREYAHVEQTIAQCLEENKVCRTTLRQEHSGAASAFALIRTNNQTIAYLSDRKTQLRKKLRLV